MRGSIVVATLTVAVLAPACGGDRPPGPPEPASPPSARQSANLAYHGIYEQPVVLTDGRFEGEPFIEGGAARPRVRLVENPRATGDLDGEAGEEAAVLLVESSGGSGSFLYLAAVGVSGGRALNLATAALGDRVQIRTMEIAERGIRVDLVQHGPQDPACCPTRLTRRVWKLVDGDLVEVDHRDLGELSLQAIAGIDWVFSGFSPGEPAPQEPRIDFRLADGRVTGSSGCNRYSGTVAESSPGSVRVGPLLGTRKACSPEWMEIEDRFLRRLEGVTRYGFVAGELALTWRDGESVGSLRFRAAG